MSMLNKHEAAMSKFSLVVVIFLSCIFFSKLAYCSQVQGIIMSDDFDIYTNGSDGVDEVAILCVKSSFASSQYQILFEGEHDASGGFRLRHENQGSYHSYTLQWRARPSSSWAAVTSGQVIGSQSGISFSASCNEDNSGQIRIHLTHAQVIALSTGVHEDDINMVLAESS